MSEKGREGLVVQASGLSDVGRRREKNEDAFLGNDDHSLYVVADGMGGHAGGGMASKMAVDKIHAVIAEYCRDPDATAESGSSRPFSGDPRDVLRYAVESASRDIYLRAAEEPKLRGMGTTVVTLWFNENKAYMGNVGDSRGYLIRGGEIVQLTVDHSLVGEQMRAGILSQDDARNHRLKNIITRSVGFQDVVDMDVVVRNVRAGDIFLLCSDGLTNMVEDQEILKVAMSSDLESACRTLVDMANAKGGDDNITLLLAKVESVNGKLVDDADATEEWDEPTVQA